MLGDLHYGWWLQEELDVTPFTRLLEERWPSWVSRLSHRVGAVRGFLLFLASRDYEFIVLPQHTSGMTTFLALEAWLRRRRRVILLEFLRFPPSDSPLRRCLNTLLFAALRKPATRRAVAAIHVFTPGERARYAAEWGVPVSRFAYIPWPWGIDRGGVLPEPLGADPEVLSAGRNYCDWETLFSAARGRPWRLTVICSADDRERVDRLNRPLRATVLSEVAFDEHLDRLRRATVHVVALRDEGVSSGQARLAHAAQAGTATVVTRARGIEGYVDEGETALVVPPRDPAALRAAVERLLEEGELRARIRQAAWERSRRWVYSDYVEAVGVLIRAVAQGRSPGCAVQAPAD